MANFQEVRDRAARLQLQVESMDWFENLCMAAGIPVKHNDACAYLDDTGHPAPCTCGYSKNSGVKFRDFVRKAIEEA